MMGDTSQYDIKKRDSGYVDFIKMTDGMEELFNFKLKTQTLLEINFNRVN